MAKHNEIGKFGEDIAAKWLRNKGFIIVERNYRKKYGEIDIVARGTLGNIHFVEVKTVSHETKSDLQRAVSHGTWRPEENVHLHKQKKFARVIETWLLERTYTGRWQIDIIAIRLVPREKYATVTYMENVIFE